MPLGTSLFSQQPQQQQQQPSGTFAFVVVSSLSPLQLSPSCEPICAATVVVVCVRSAPTRGAATTAILNNGGQRRRRRRWQQQPLHRGAKRRSNAPAPAESIVLETRQMKCVCVFNARCQLLLLLLWFPLQKLLSLLTPNWCSFSCRPLYHHFESVNVWSVTFNGWLSIMSDDEWTECVFLCFYVTKRSTTATTTRLVCLALLYNFLIEVVNVVVIDLLLYSEYHLVSYFIEKYLFYNWALLEKMTPFSLKAVFSSVGANAPFSLC